MPTNFAQLINIFVRLINATLPILVGLALIVFFWGLIKFVSRVGGDEKAVTEGKALMKWGLIALFVMVSFIGIIRFFYSDLFPGLEFALPLLPGGLPPER